MASEEHKKKREIQSRTPSAALKATSPIRLTKKPLNIDIKLPEKVN